MTHFLQNISALLEDKFSPVMFVRSSVLEIIIWLNTLLSVQTQ